MRSYAAIHCYDDTKDYSEPLDKRQLIAYLMTLSLSTDGKKPLTAQQVGRKGERWLRETYNNIQKTDNICDISQAAPEDLWIEDTDDFVYLMTYSFPCFTSDTLILTSDGYKKIIDVKPGDTVMCHDAQFHKVMTSKKTGTKQIYEVSGMTTDKIRCTENHKFYVRKMYHKWPYLPNGKRASLRLFHDPEWVECKDLKKGDYLGFPINTNSIIPDWDGITFTWSDGRKDRHKNQLKQYMNNPDFWELIGMYVGDGWRRPQGGIIISGNENKKNHIISLTEKLNINTASVFDRTAYKVHIPLKEIEKFVEPFGKGAQNKRIPGFVLDLPVELASAFLNGYMSADGSFNGKTYSCCSASKELIYGLAQIVAKVYHRPSGINTVRVEPTSVIEGRVVNQKPQWQLRYKISSDKQDKAFYEDGYVWYPFYGVEKTDSVEDVYDIEVEDAHTFIADGAIVHNCTSLSQAGSMTGMKEGSGTASSLLWEVKRLLGGLKELPQVLIMENVPQVHSGKNMPEFQKWIDFLTSLGYSSKFQDMNAVDYGVAQSRNRTIMVSLLGDYDFEFPKPIPLTKVMADYLDEEVDERFYVNTDKAQDLIDRLIREGRLPEPDPKDIYPLQ